MTRKLPKKQLQEKVDQIFPSSYTTIIALIQSVAFGILAVKANELFTTRGVIVVDSLQIAFCFSLIVVLWNEYHWSALLFAWVPNVLDSFLPFLLGVIEIAMIYSIALKRFYLLVIIMSLLGACAYGYTYSKYSSNKSNYDEKLFEICSHTSKFAIILCVLFGIIFFLFGLGCYFYPGMNLHLYLLFSAFILLAFLLMNSYMAIRSIYDWMEEEAEE